MQQFSFNSVSLYYAKFSELWEEVACCRNALSRDEMLRAEKFYFERDQKKFIIARGYLRKLLAKNLAISSKKVRFAYGEFGKPYLPDYPLKFNLAHNHNAFVIAISRTAELGVDVENIKREVDYAGIGEQIFSLAEKAYFASIPLKQQARVFYRCWVRKEAFVKALGVGLNFDLTTLTLVQAGNDLLSIEHQGQRWQIDDLLMHNGDCIALVTAQN